jgi:hypothetical protein
MMHRGFVKGRCRFRIGSRDDLSYVNDRAGMCAMLFQDYLLFGTGFAAAPRPLKCLDFTASSERSTIGVNAGPLLFPLPIPAASDTATIPVAGLRGNITWPEISAGTATVQTTQVQFYPVQGANYGGVAFAASSANLVEPGAQLVAGGLSTGTTYTDPH